MAEVPLFVYNELPAGHIRLLTPTSPASKDGQSWSLQTVSLDQPDLVYDALSYAWGSQDDLFPIILNGAVSHVHSNLHSALPCLAGRGKHRPVLPIWIDAISINQADHEEKMNQIRKMNSIYRRAARVWVWLGIPEHPERISEAIEFSHLASVERIRLMDLHRVDFSLRSTVIHFMTNDWFRRLWVVQEAALAQEISFLTGDVELQWSDMEKAMADTKNCLIFRSRTWAQWYWNDSDLFDFGPAAMLMNVAAVGAQTQECTQPEDRVLGLLGLVDQDDLSDTFLDTGIAHTSYQDLFTRFSAYILTQYPDPNRTVWWVWLGLAFVPKKCEGLPSWVPDLHGISRATHLLADLELAVPSYHAVDGRKNEPRGGSKTGQLILRGRILDEVVMVFEPTPINIALYMGNTLVGKSDIPIAVAEWEAKLAHDVMHCTASKSRQENDAGLNLGITSDTYWRTLIGNKASVQDEAVVRDWYDDFRAISRGLTEASTAHGIKRPYTSLPHPETDTAEPQWQETNRQTKQYRNACHFLDLMAILHWVRPGDMVSALNGSPVLHVLRRVPTEDDTKAMAFEFVGSAYVHGLMNGESDNIDADEKDLMFL